MNADISTLYIDCRKDLLSYLTRLSHCRDTAEDIAQEAFTVLMRSAKKIAVQHRVLFYLGRRLTLRSNMSAITKSLAFIITKNLFYPMTRKIFILQKLHGMSYREIALHLSISVSAVEKHISRGIQHCLNQLRQMPQWVCDITHFWF